MDALKELLTSYERVGLKKEEAQLPRMDIKFALPVERLESFLKHLVPFYSILCINTKLLLAYSTRYFDTAGLDMYLAHHNGKLNRFKIRERTYLASGQKFLEIKLKSNTRRTLKQRISQSPSDLVWQAPAMKFISSLTPYDPDALIPSLCVDYTRIMLFNKQGGERVTIDLDIRFSNAQSCFKLSKFTLVEIKQYTKMKTPAVTEFEILKIRPRSFSKYCFGINNLYPGIKKNNFKERYSSLNTNMA